MALKVFDPDEGEELALARTSPKVYPRGVVLTELAFPHPGRYAVALEVGDEEPQAACLGLYVETINWGAVISRVVYWGVLLGLVWFIGGRIWRFVSRLRRHLKGAAAAAVTNDGRGPQGSDLEVTMPMTQRCRRLPALLAWLVAVGVAMGAVPAWAHGGVSMESNVCLLTIGSYRMNFTGYQPQVARSKEFCDDIPAVGEGIIVLDFIDKALRDCVFEVRFLEDGKGLKYGAASIDQLGTDEEIEQATIFKVGPEQFPTGSVTLDYVFRDKGYHIGVARAWRPGEKDKMLVPVFPFSVGIVGQRYWAWAGLALLLVALAGGYLLWDRRRRAAASPGAQAG